MGRVGKELASRCESWVGSDISPNMLRVAGRRLKNLPNVSLQLLEKSSFKGVFTDGEFDKAYSVAVFCHLDKEDLFLYLRDLYRVIRPGGILYVETWNLAHPIGWYRWEYEVRHWSRLTCNQRKDAGRNQFCHPKEFELYVERAGFDILVQFNGSPWMQIVAGKETSNQRKQILKTHLVKNADVISFSETFSECYEKIIDLQYGEIDVNEMMVFLDSYDGEEEAALFRSYVESKWIRPKEQYRELVKKIRQIVTTTLLPAAIVVVVSKGDEELISLDGRSAWHFMQEENGSFSGHYPESSASAIWQLKRLRARGAQFLVLPSTFFWWLSYYSEFAEYLAERYSSVEYKDVCLVYSLTETAADHT